MNSDFLVRQVSKDEDVIFHEGTLMRILVLALVILLAFVLLEIRLLTILAQRFGWALLGYLLLAALLGWVLIMDERQMATSRLLQILKQGQHPLRALFASAGKVIAGLLLIFPGVLSDALAGLLLLASWLPPRRKPRQDDDSIEGKWHRED